MKRFVIVLCLLVATLSASAQFERGTFMVNAALSGANLSYSSQEKGVFGLGATGGLFLVDDFALMGTLGMDLTDPVNEYYFGLGGRYYLEDNGIFLGGGVKASTYSYKNADDDNDFALTAEAGYAFFLSKTVTIEPSVYYNLSLKDGDYSKIGARIGFSIYF
jgi:hypothetical protein